MAKLSIIIYIAVAVLLLLLVSRSPEKSSSHHGRSHRRLKLRSNFTFNAPLVNHHEPVAFDPLVAELERHREDKLWEKQYYEKAHPERVQSGEAARGEVESRPEWEDLIDAEDYLNDEEKFNVTDRLILLFPKIDVDPADGYLSEQELSKWNLQQAQTEMMHRTQREMELHDKNRDGYVSFTEYEAPKWVHNANNESFGYEIGWWKEDHFNASDADGDGLLNVTEFNDFLNPSDSANPKLLQWLCKEEVRQRDSDKDGKINFKEFLHGLFDLFRNYIIYDDDHHDSSSSPSKEASAKMLFNQLDKDSDGYLSDVELLPVIGKLHPSERYYAKQQANYMISQADGDEDGCLTLLEMIESPYAFYSAFYRGDDDDGDYHDEFR